MKRLFAILIPICIISFILFGISVAMFGTLDEHPTADYVHDEITIDEGFDNIEIDCSGAEINLKKSLNGTARVEMDVDEKKPAAFEAYAKDGTLYIKSEYIVFGWDKNLNFWNNLGNIFDEIKSGNFMNFVSNRITVYVPDKLYNKLYVELNAGNVKIRDLTAKYNEIALNAGSLDYIAPSTEAEYLGVEVNAGEVKIDGIHPREYKIDESAGSVKVTGLTGFGSVDVSAGAAKLDFERLDGDMQIDVSAGSVDVILPRDASAEIYADKSAGDVRVKFNDKSKSLDDNETYTIGSGKYRIDVDISAGDVKILSRDEQATTAVTTTIDDDRISEVAPIEVTENTVVEEKIESAVE